MSCFRVAVDSRQCDIFCAACPDRRRRRAGFVDPRRQSAKLGRMGERKQIGVISLGVMGQRMLARLAEHPRIRVLAAWDPNPAAVAEV